MLPIHEIVQIAVANDTMVQAAFFRGLGISLKNDRHLTASSDVDLVTNIALVRHTQVALFGEKYISSPCNTLNLCIQGFSDIPEAIDFR